MNFLTRWFLRHTAKTVEKSLPHLTDDDLHLQWDRAQLNMLDATDPEAEIIHLGMSRSIGEEMRKRGLV